MADGVTVKLLGIDDLKRATDELRVDLRRRVVRAALRDAAKPILSAAKAARIKRSVTGALVRSIVIRSSKIFNGKRGEIGVYVGVRARKSKNEKNSTDPFYWRFIEFGTKKMDKRPFLVPAFNAKAGQALRIFQDRLRARIELANRRK